MKLSHQHSSSEMTCFDMPCRYSLHHSPKYENTHPHISPWLFLLCFYIRNRIQFKLLFTRNLLLDSRCRYIHFNQMEKQLRGQSQKNKFLFKNARRRIVEWKKPARSRDAFLKVELDCCVFRTQCHARDATKNLRHERNDKTHTSSSYSAT